MTESCNHCFKSRNMIIRGLKKTEKRNGRPNHVYLFQTVITTLCHNESRISFWNLEEYLISTFSTLRVCPSVSVFCLK